MKKQSKNSMKISAIEAKLKALNAEDIFELCEPAPLSKNELKYLKNNLNKTGMEKVIFEAKSQITNAILPFGRYLQTIRVKSELTVQNIASLLKMEHSYISKIENGQIHPIKISVNKMVDIMQLFRINLSELKMTIEAFLKIDSFKGKRVAGMARSSFKNGTNDRAETLSHAMDAVLQKIATKKSDKKKVSIDSNYIKSIETELQKREDSDLLV